MLCVCQGCGTGAYRARMDKRLDQLRRGAPSGGGLYAASQVPGTPLWIRVPQVFTQGLVPGAVVDGKPVNAARIQPPITIPGLKATWEGRIDHEGSKLPYYCYLAATEKDPTGTIQRELKQLYENLEVNWTDYTDPAGKTWKRWRGDVSQDWIPQDASGTDMSSRALPGMLEFECRQEGRYWMVVGWRVPRAIESAARLDGIIGPVLGSLEQK